MPSPQLVLGTQNRKKGWELAELLAPLGTAVRTLAELPHAVDVEEDGATFAENAANKATVQARALSAWVLGEDSGLEVDALRGAPGIYSARFSGATATDESNNRLLLERLSGVPPDRRTARYVCHATLSDPQGRVQAEAEAYCRGRITESPRGGGGFGYDPLFEIVEYRRTFGEMGPAVKACLSHRGRALRSLLPEFSRLIGAGHWR